MHRLSIRGFAMLLYGLVHLLYMHRRVCTAPCTRIRAGTLYRCATMYFVAAAGNIPPFMFTSDVSASAFSCGASFPACSCTLWFREHGGGALHPSGNCAGPWLWSKCRKNIAWPRAAGLAGVFAPFGGPGSTVAGAGGHGAGFWRFAPGVPIVGTAPRPRS